MERLWAPWRIGYVSGCDVNDKGCCLCTIPDGDEKTNKILQKGKYCYVVMNIYPYNNGHLMVLPYRHIARFNDLTPEEKVEVLELIGLWTDILQKIMCCHGFNVGVNLGRIAGAGIADHLHFHIVPRWDGDTNFMPVIGETKVIPQSLEDTWQLLKKAWEENKGQGG